VFWISIGGIWNTVVHNNEECHDKMNNNQPPKKDLVLYS
jgi:hypothetical protein